MDSLYSFIELNPVGLVDLYAFKLLIVVKLTFDDFLCLAAVAQHIRKSPQVKFRWAAKCVLEFKNTIRRCAFDPDLLWLALQLDLSCARNRLLYLLLRQYDLVLRCR